MGLGSPRSRGLEVERDLYVRFQHVPACESSVPDLLGRSATRYPRRVGGGGVSNRCCGAGGWDDAGCFGDVLSAFGWGRDGLAGMVWGGAGVYCIAGIRKGCTGA